MSPIITDFSFVSNTFYQAIQRPWLVLVPQPLLKSAPCSLYGVVYEERWLVRADSISPGAGLQNIGFIHQNEGSGPFSISGPYSLGQVAIFDFDRFRSICQLHCSDCVTQMLGSKLSAMHDLEISSVPKDQCSSCYRKATKNK